MLGCFGSTADTADRRVVLGVLILDRGGTLGKRDGMVVSKCCCAAAVREGHVKHTLVFGHLSVLFFPEGGSTQQGGP